MNAPLPQMPRFWNAAQTKLRCVAIVPEAPDVKTIHFAAEDGAWFRYLPGQFVTLALPVPSGTVHRTYTLSSTPSRPQRASVTVKAQKDSIGTRWLLDHLKIGDKIAAVGPAGDFTLPSDPKRLLLISGGSGVTPMMSMTRYLHDLATETDIAFLHFARSPDDLLFTAELDGLAGAWPSLKPRFIVEQAQHHWAGPTGRPSEALLHQLCPDLDSRDVFCCGPAPFMTAVRDAVTAIAGGLARYREESFQPAAPTPSPAPAVAGKIEIRFAASNKQVAITGTETILQAAQAAGIPLPYACQMGLCGTCMVKKSAGEVAMEHQGGITDEDIATGYILACCARPASDRIEIEL